MMNETIPSDPGPRQEFLDAFFETEVPLLDLPTRFGVVTAYNPDGILAADDLNVAADARLRFHLEKAGLIHFRVTGRSQDGHHQEPGFGIAIDDPEEIRLLCQQFEQQAFFWVQEGIIYCVERDGVTFHRVGLWSERQ